MSILLQITQAVTDSATALQPAVKAEQSISFLDLVIKGGPIMIPLGLLSVAAVYIFFERYFTIRKSSNIDKNFINQIKDFVHTGNVDAAKALCRNTNHPVARMIEKGLLRLGKPIRDIESSIENVGKLEIYKLEKNLSFLGTIAGIAPMFGFLGTIFGVIKIFYQISLENSLQIDTISGGLYVKMITSAAGLLIGVAAYAGYHYLISLVDRAVNKMEINAVEFIDLLEEPVKK
ncbi:MAG: MotA/TolQ/ExbB proton channel family protein [Bacteroidetes bacterium]|jgi:biopolymer transport protein ExbB|nr:MotA/TolQ/ExbB proton channel family protein [Bacteroidia bacterium]MBS1922518.1 MotA/TolQ/ExbB proton channel family protein [Bacteroidota bacterium]MBP7714219.1 MotA/TolQ/ExbB proton channel family protein [Bacteroidia bacterium]MBP8668129.1 MotA/TolQ/ExbB proton channel family protein [Bacteroidia bacterium]MCC7515461.1 MotA/TolQ/ExbB proton channel family protein [Bacteroidia bacterium]